MSAVILRSQQTKQEFAGVERKASQSADQRSIEPDVLQVAADIDLDQRNQLPHVPCLDLIDDERGDSALLIRDETAQHRDESFVDFTAQFGIGGKRLARFHEHAGEMLLQDLALAAGAALDERARVRPHGFGKLAELRTRKEITLESIDAFGITLVV